MLLEDIILEKRGLLDRKADLLDKSYSRLISILDNNTITNMDKTVELLKENLDDDKCIVLNTDFDVDGMTSMAILHNGLKEVFGFKGELIIINNNRELGRGINNTTMMEVENLSKIKKIDLFITGDHGSTDKEQVNKLMSMGIKCIITDHHLYDEESKVETPYFINPIFENNQFKFISGATVLYVLFYKLAKALDSDKYLPILQLELLPLAALTTISDMMDMREPINRCLVHNGIKVMTVSKKIVFQEMIKTVKSKRVITSGQLGAIISPIINSAGRMNKSMLGIRFLISPDTEAKFNYEKLKQVNKDRKEYLEDIMKDVKHKVDFYRQKYKNINVVVLEEGGGIAGIVASRLGDQYSKPTFVLTKGEDGYNCSARAIVEGVHIEETVKKLKEKGLILKGGGHKGAGGCLIPLDKLKDFLEELNSIFEGITNEDFKADVIEANNFKLLDLHKTVFKLEPFGNFFPTPMFKQTFKILRKNRLGMTEHIKFIVERDGIMTDALCFNMLSKADKFKPGDDITLIFKTELKSDNISLIVDDIELVRKSGKT